MRKTNDKFLKEAIEQMLQVYKIKRRYDESAASATAGAHRLAAVRASGATSHSSSKPTQAQ